MQNRFKPKFVNSFWVVFDNANYENVQVCYLAVEAERISNKMNKGVK